MSVGSPQTSVGFRLKNSSKLEYSLRSEICVVAERHGSVSSNRNVLLYSAAFIICNEIC